MKPISLYLPDIPWFLDLLRDINNLESLSSHVFRLAAEDLLSRGLIKESEYKKACEEYEKSSRTRRKAVMSGKFRACKLYIKDAFVPLMKAVDKNFQSRTSYFWSLVVKNAAIKPEQKQEFLANYPEIKL